MLRAALTLPPLSFAYTFLCASRNRDFVQPHFTLKIRFRKKKHLIIPLYLSLLNSQRNHASQVLRKFALTAVTKSLQAKNCDLGHAYQSVTLAKECIKSERGDESWQKVWSLISQVADSINVTLIKPRTTTVQRHRANAAHNDQPSDYYRINVFYPFIDHVVGELETRFSV